MKVRHHRKRFLRLFHRERRAWWVLAFAIIAVFAGVTRWLVLSSSNSRDPWQRSVSAPNPSAKSSPATSETLVIRPPNPAKSARPVYAYSLVPGGIRDAAELRSAMVRDSVIFAEYSTFHLERARVIRLDSARQAHVAYRIGNRVYWTKRKVKLEKGETVITDGVQTARTKCGNLVSEDVEGVVSPNEPTEQALNTPRNRAGPNDPATTATPADPPLSANPAPRPYDTPPSPIRGRAPGPVRRPRHGFHSLLPCPFRSGLVPVLPAGSTERPPAFPGALRPPVTLLAGSSCSVGPSVPPVITTPSGTAAQFPPGLAGDPVPRSDGRQSRLEGAAERALL
jgi:hypothetical protein